MNKILLTGLVVVLIITGYFLYKSNGLRPTVSPKNLPSTPPTIINTTGLTILQGFNMTIFAQNLGNARDLEFSPEATLLVSIPADGKILALVDSDGDGQSQTREILTGLRRPHGLAFYQGKLFVAEETKVSRYNWNEQNLSASLDKKLFDLPAGGRHFTRTLAFNKDGRLFVSIGSTCDVCFEDHEWAGSVIVSDSEGTRPKLFAKGLRNSVFITINPQTGQLWGTEMGRDFLGDEKPPDEINIIGEGKDYGWPLCYGRQVHDTDFDKKVYIQIIPQPPCGETEPPIYEIAAHSAPLGLQFVISEKFPKDWQGDLLVAYHGSWNRSTPIGYKVVHINLANGQATGEEDFITGFLQGNEAIARPVDLIFDNLGALYISDDKGGYIFKVDSR